MCHVNMLKKYYSSEKLERSQEKVEPALAISPDAVVDSCALIVTDAAGLPDNDRLAMPHLSYHTAHLPNSEMLQLLPQRLQHLSADQQHDVIELIHRFLCLFNDVPTQTTVLQHDINVEDAKPNKQHPYRLNPVKRALMKKETDYLVEHGFAKPSSSTWSSPCLLEAKTDGSPRFITDYRKVNAVTVPDSYPLPRMEDCVDNLGTAQFVSKLDLLKGY